MAEIVGRLCLVGALLGIGGVLAVICMYLLVTWPRPAATTPGMAGAAVVDGVDEGGHGRTRTDTDWQPSEREPRGREDESDAARLSLRRGAPLVVAAPAVRQGPPLAVACSARGDPTRTGELRRGAPLLVQHNAALWAEKGWQETPVGYAGAFRAAGRQWRGLIEAPYPGAYRALIWEPPLGALAGHPHRPCFRRNGHGPECYEVHYNEMPQSLDHAITTVEMVLADALTRRTG